jgi:hypothetical protein
MRLSHAPRLTGSIGLRKVAALAASTFLALVPALQAGPPAPLAGTGTIKGKLVWAGGAIPAPKVDVLKDDPKVKDPICKAKEILNKDLVIDPESKGIANAFAYLVSPTGDFSAVAKELVAKKPEVVVDQIGCEYLPYASVVHKDQKLTFKSSDPVGHNVDFKPFNNDKINPMLPPNGKYDYKITKGGERRPTAAICSIHPWMKGFVLISDHPFAAVTKPDGSFEITGVPAGNQQLIVWQSTKGYVTEGAGKGMTVKVPDGGIANIGELKFVPR